MAAVTVTVNSTSLATLASRIERMQRSTPVLRGTDLDLPGRHGVLRLPRRLHGPGTIVWPMWVKGVDPDTGLIVGSSVDEIRQRADELGRLFHADPLDVRYTYPGGTVRQAIARLALDPLDFTQDSPSAPEFGKFVAALTIPDSFWSDLSAVTAGPNAFSTGGTQALTGFAGATAPMDELTVTFGPGANPELTQPSSGYLLAYDGVIAAGQQLQVDTATWSVGPGSGSAWTPDVTKVRFGPESRFFSLQPEPGGVAPTIRVTHTGGGQVSVTISGKRRFLTG